MGEQQRMRSTPFLFLHLGLQILPGTLWLLLLSSCSGCIAFPLGLAAQCCSCRRGRLLVAAAAARCSCCRCCSRSRCSLGCTCSWFGHHSFCGAGGAGLDGLHCRLRGAGFVRLCLAGFRGLGRDVAAGGALCRRWSIRASAAGHIALATSR